MSVYHVLKFINYINIMNNNDHKSEGIQLWISVFPFCSTKLLPLPFLVNHPLYIEFIIYVLMNKIDTRFGQHIFLDVCFATLGTLFSLFPMMILCLQAWIIYHMVEMHSQNSKRPHGGFN